MTKEKKIMKTIVKLGKGLGVGLSEQEKKLKRKREMKALRYKVEKAEQIRKLEKTKAKIRKSRLEARPKEISQSVPNQAVILGSSIFFMIYALSSPMVQLMV